VGHGRVAHPVRQRRDEILGERRLPGSGSAGDPDGDPTVRTHAVETRRHSLDQRIEVWRREQA
jgi:hypothetical protein